MQDYQLRFIDLALSRDALRFGNFKLKSGRESPYFFNAGLFSDGDSVALLGQCYAAAILHSGVEFDMVFGPAYKGIPLVAAVACALAERGIDRPFAYNRKEAKDHGEGGLLVGAKVAGRVLIVDDVLTAGTAMRESYELLKAAGALPIAAITALDRQEVGPNGRSAVAELSDQLGISVISLVTVQDLLEHLNTSGGDRAIGQAIQAYQARYGVSKN